MKTTLTRAAVVAATRIVQDGGSTGVDLIAAVREAHVSLFDTEAREELPVDRDRLQGAADFAGDLVNFASAIIEREPK